MKRPSIRRTFREDLGVGERAGGGGTESEHTLGAGRVVAARPEQEALVIVVELSGIRIEDVRRPVEEVPVEGVESSSAAGRSPHTPHIHQRTVGEKGGHGTLHAQPTACVAVVHIVWRRGDDDGHVVLFTIAGSSVATQQNRQRKVSVEVDVQRGGRGRPARIPARRPASSALGRPAVPWSSKPRLAITWPAVQPRSRR